MWNGLVLMKNQKCESCRRGFNGRNSNGYMPCGCGKVIYAKSLTSKEKSEVHKKLKDAMEADLKNPLYSKRNRIEPRPEFVPPPPLMPIGQPRIGWKPKPINTDQYEDFNGLLLITIMVCLIVVGFVMGYLHAASHVS